MGLEDKATLSRFSVPQLRRYESLSFSLDRVDTWRGCKPSGGAECVALVVVVTFQVVTVNLHRVHVETRTRATWMVCIVLYLLTAEHLLHHAFMFRGVVAGVCGCEGAVTAERREEDCQPKEHGNILKLNQLHQINRLRLSTRLQSTSKLRNRQKHKLKSWSKH